ncbi:MAG: hydroxymethylbilane synthase [Bdellovibrio sp.]|nr:hydroxymethylbilane synthase [Bdellovibrio sp.]
MRSTIKLGTRRSLLAWSQSLGIAKTLEALNSDTFHSVKIELVGIETRGDKIQDVPLNQVQGKEFFVEELDTALRSGAVDMTVHSLKDLSLVRPKEFVCAAIPKRENSRDVAIFNSHVIPKLRSNQTIKIGTSSPRRLENIPPFLAQALPWQKRKLDFIEIRGNINTRIARLHELPQNPRYLDGVVLAMAGLIRLWADPIAREELKVLLKDTLLMILPLKTCPSAPGQGALAIECLASNTELRKLLLLIHHTETERHVLQERALLSDWGGGCHQAFGATSVCEGKLGDCFFIRGKKPDGSFVDEFKWHAPPALSPSDNPRNAWNGLDWAKKCTQKELLINTLNIHDNTAVVNHIHENIAVVNHIHENAIAVVNHIHENIAVVNHIHENIAVFIAHSNALPEKNNLTADHRIYTSGLESWFRLAAQGIWVEGCGEGLGFNSLIATLQEPVLQLPKLSDWTILTHDDATETWNTGNVIPTYRVRHNYDDQAKSALINATHVFWASGSQFIRLKDIVQPQAHLACGPGKTAELLQSKHIKTLVFPSVKEWKQWLKII